MNSFALYNIVSSGDSKKYFYNLYFSKVKRKISIKDCIIKKGVSLVIIRESLAGSFGRSYVNFYTVQKIKRNQLNVYVNVVPLVIGFN